MNLTLQRRLYRADGIFSDLIDESGKVIAVTLDHAYLSDLGKYQPKLGPGVYTCQRSPHRLHGMSQDFITFQIMNVPGHSNVLYHWGNYNADSDGCVLLGQKVAFVNGTKMITRSKDTWSAFMQLESNVDSFQLTVLA